MSRVYALHMHKAFNECDAGNFLNCAADLFEAEATARGGSHAATWDHFAFALRQLSRAAFEQLTGFDHRGRPEWMADGSSALDATCGQEELPASEAERYQAQIADLSACNDRQKKEFERMREEIVGLEAKAERLRKLLELSDGKRLYLQNYADHSHKHIREFLDQMATLRADTVGRIQTGGA